MKKPLPNPDVADLAPTDSVLTVYDEEHIITYLRMLDADAEGADWGEVAKSVEALRHDLTVLDHRQRKMRKEQKAAAQIEPAEPPAETAAPPTTGSAPSEPPAIEA